MQNVKLSGNATSPVVTAVAVWAPPPPPSLPPLPGLQHRPPITAVVYQLLHLILRMPLRLLYPWLKHHDLVLLQRVLAELRAQRGFDAEPNLEVAV